MHGWPLYTASLIGCFIHQPHIHAFHLETTYVVTFLKTILPFQKYELQCDLFELREHVRDGDIETLKANSVLKRWVLSRSRSLFDGMTLYCSAEFSEGLQRIGFGLINIALAVTAGMRNTLILIALHKETLLHPPSKILLRSLTLIDLCIGLLTLVFQTYCMSMTLEQWKIKAHKPKSP